MQESLWNIPHVMGNRVTPGTRRLFMGPDVFTWPSGSVFWARGVASTYAVFDRDGSTIGQPGYIVANRSQLLPPAGKGQCTPVPEWNAMSCPGTCYRMVYVAYWEDGFATNASWVRGDWR